MAFSQQIINERHNVLAPICEVLRDLRASTIAEISAYFPDIESVMNLPESAADTIPEDGLAKEVTGAEYVALQGIIGQINTILNNGGNAALIHKFCKKVQTI